jgi:hypothetical protein
LLLLGYAWGGHESDGPGAGIDGSAGPRDVEARRHRRLVPGTDNTTHSWGYHGYEYSLALGNLLHDVVGEEAAWQSGPATGSLSGCGRRSR